MDTWIHGNTYSNTEFLRRSADDLRTKKIIIGRSIKFEIFKCLQTIICDNNCHLVIIIFKRIENGVNTGEVSSFSMILKCGLIKKNAFNDYIQRPSRATVFRFIDGLQNFEEVEILSWMKNT